MRALAAPHPFAVLLPLLLPLVTVLLAGIHGGSVADASPSVRFELLRADQLFHHRHSGGAHRPTAGGGGSTATTSYITAVAREDAARQGMIRARLEERRWRRHGTRGRRKACESNSTTLPPAPPPTSPSRPASSSFAMPVSSGAYTGTGQYFVKFQVGTPAQKFLLVVDTGSDLTWMKCRYKGAVAAAPAADGPGNTSSSSGGRSGRLFDAGSSKSFHPIACSTSLCKGTLPFSLARCPSRSTPCGYDYSYADGSHARGVFAKEWASVVLSPSGRRTKLRGIVVGCTSSFTGQSFRASDGVLGLGYSKTSFAARATGLFGGKFSYCLVDHLSPKNVSNYLVFGDEDVSITGGGAGGGGVEDAMRYADLVLDPRLEPFYAVKVAGISIGGTMLDDIPASTWDVSSGGGAIMDSGTSLTVLAEPAYKSVTAALTRSLRAYPRMPRGAVKPFDFCYNTTAALPVPRLVIHLRGPGGLVRLEPPVKSYVVDVADGVKCLGFLSAPSPGTSTFGNILQQNHRWEFDIAHRRLGFAPSNC